MKKIIFSLVLALNVPILYGQQVFRHVTDSTNTSGHITTLEHPQLNGNESAIIFIMPVWNNGTEAYTCGNYAQNAGVWYDRGRKKWTIFNENTAILMPQNVAFNVLIAPKDNPNYFTVTCDEASKTANGFPNGMVLNTPATNNKPNALLLVTQNFLTTYNNNSQLVGYAKGKWRIANNNYFFPVCEGNKSFMPIGARFNVMVIEKGIVPGFPKASAFLHKTTNIPPAANIEYINPHVSVFDAAANNVFNSDKSTLLFATPNWGWTQEERPVGAPIGNLETDSPLVIWQSRFTNKWAVVNATAIPFKEGTLINVVAIKP
jgi:hypothetical protein